MLERINGKITNFLGKKIVNEVSVSSGVDVKITHLQKSFGEKQILKDVNFECQRGESVIILGESGMGKSVMMRIIGMLLDADEGSIKIGGQEIVGITDRNKEKMMKNVGFLFQYSGLFEHLSIWQNIMFYELFIQHQDTEEMKEVALDVMESLNIPSSAVDLKPSEISGGMQRRVALARTIIKKPSLILLDEPTTGLDPVVCENVNNTINLTKKQTGATMITISHDLNSAIQTGDKIVVLRYGEIIWQGKPRDIFDCDDKYIQDYVKAANVKV